MSEIEPSQLVTIARIVRPQGIRGEVIADLETDFPERFADLDTVYLCSEKGSVTEVGLEDFWFHKGRVVLKLEGYDSRNAAEALRNYTIRIDEDALVELPEDTYYEFDLIGCSVLRVDAGREIPVGVVEGLMPTGSVPNLIVRGKEGREYLIPFANAICREVDTSNKRILITPPEGLLAL